MSSRRRHIGNRENPPSNRCLGIFGLSSKTNERDLKEVFCKYGPLEDIQIIYDAKSGASRGFAFVYFETEADAGEVSAQRDPRFDPKSNPLPRPPGQRTVQRHLHWWP